MSFSLHEPESPEKDLNECTDAERRIARRVWDLPAVQAAIGSGRLVVLPSASASLDLSYSNWSTDDLKRYLCTLSAGRYSKSEWCAVSSRAPPLAADVYLMGFNRMMGVENQATRPWKYVKFSVRPTNSKVIVLSCHDAQFN